MAYYRRFRFRRRFYRRYRKYSRWVKRPQAASSLKQMSLPIRKTFSVSFTINQGSLSSVVKLCALPPSSGSEYILIADNVPFNSLRSLFDEVRCKSFGIQLTPGLNTGFPPGALLICPDRKRYITSEVDDAPLANEMLVSPSTQVVGFTQFSTLQTRRSLYASTTVERQSFIDTTALDDITTPLPPTAVFSPAFYLAVRLAAAPTTTVTIPCTVTMTGVFVFRNPAN